MTTWLIRSARRPSHQASASPLNAADCAPMAPAYRSSCSPELADFGANSATEPLPHVSHHVLEPSSVITQLLTCPLLAPVALY